MKYFVLAFALVASAAITVRPVQAQSTDDFLMKAMESNYAEVQLGHLAQSKAQNPQVKDFANMMVQDHEQSLEKLHNMIGSTSGMNDVTPDMAQNHENADPCGSSVSDSSQDSDTQNQQSSAHIRMSPEDQQLCQRLSQLSGQEFDKAYINAMVEDHKKDVSLFEQVAGESGAGSSTSDLNREKPESSNASNEAQDFARETLPTLKKHLQAAENLQQQLQ